MRKAFLAIASLFALTTLGTADDKNADVRRYVAEFIEQCRARCSPGNLTLMEKNIKELKRAEATDDMGATLKEFGAEPEPGIAGVCFISHEKEERYFFFRSSIKEPLRRGVIYHELAHCLLDRMHAPTGTMSLMEPFVRKDLSFYSDNWDALLDELFTTFIY